MDKDIVDLQTKLGTSVAKLRKKRKMTKYEVHKKSGLTQSQIKNIEDGKHTINLHTLIKLGNGLGVNFYDLIINALK